MAPAPRHRAAPSDTVDIERAGDGPPPEFLNTKYRSEAAPSPQHGEACATSRTMVGRFPATLLVTGNCFHQRLYLALYGLILDLAIGPQQPEAERAVEIQQALDFLGFTV